MRVRPCAVHGCPNLGEGRFCAEDHDDLNRQPWQTSKRRSHRDGSGWKEQAAAKRVMRRDRGVCHVCGKPGADQVDHVKPLAEGGSDTDENKAPIHRVPCHRDKTRAEAQRARKGRR